jgi:4'-phosphopantetheinyl transferase
VLALADNEIHVWFVRPERATADSLTRAYQALMSTDERERHRRFYFDRDRHTFLVARALVRTTLSRYADVRPEVWTFAAGPHGRPEIASPRGLPPLRFNLSHTQGLVAIAVALGMDLGIDVEGKRRETTADVARRFFAPPEVRYFESVGPERQPDVFLDFWTLKEAYIKATGEGLSAGLSSFAMRLDDPPTVSFTNGDNANAPDWHFRRLQLTDAHVSSLAVRRPGAAPSIVVRETVPLGDVPDVRP